MITPSNLLAVQVFAAMQSADLELRALAISLATRSIDGSPALHRTLRAFCKALNRRCT